MAKLDLRVGTTLLIPAHELDEQASRSRGAGWAARKQDVQSGHAQMESEEESVLE
ncbi:MAG: hypothetical protein ACJZ7Z_10460 [Myxococcota bacterium]